jgi:uncharacterized protein RhaS with RHS repeats
MQQRYYDPMIGRSLSVDPVTAYSSPGANFNRYWYANNNPYRFTDPDGRQSVGEMLHQRTEDEFRRSGGGLKAFSLVFAETAWKHLGAKGVGQVADKGWSGSSGGDKAGAGLEVLSAVPGVKLAGAAGKEVTTVIGKLADLKGGLRSGERTLLDKLPNLGNPKAN